MKPSLVVFVCTGNICRSPMAERLLHSKLGPASGWSVASAGLMAGYGHPASEAAVTALREVGVDMTDHVSRPLTAALANAATLIIVMTAAHKDQLQLRFSGTGEKAFLLKSFLDEPGADVLDPIGMPLSVYRKLRDDMNEAIPEIIEFLSHLTNKG